MAASLTYVSFCDDMKHTCVEAFNVVRVGSQKAASKNDSAATSTSSTTGSVSAVQFNYQTLEEKIAVIMRKLRKGEIFLANGKSAEDLKLELRSPQYAGKSTNEMIQDLKTSKLLKSEPKPKPEEPKPEFAKYRPKLLAPSFAAA